MEQTTSLSELENNLQEYKQQLKQVESLLLDEPENQEYSSIYTDLEEAIRETEGLLKEALVLQQQTDFNEFSQLQNQSLQDYQYQLGQHQLLQQQGQQEASKFAPVTLHLPSILPTSVAQQIRSAQIKAAIAGKAPAQWAIGAACQVQYLADGNWYDAVIEGVSQSNNFLVKYESYEEVDEVQDVSRVRLKLNDDGYQGVAAPKRKKVEENPILSEIPKWVQIKETDDEKTKLRKKKLIKKYKSEMRFQQMDLQQKEKQDKWQKFQQTKAFKKRSGFMTGRKRDSIFKVPEENRSKVGVVNSGKNMTQVPKRAKVSFRDE